MPHPAVKSLALTNRLGQAVTLGVKFVPGKARDTLFVSAPREQASSFFGKNAEPFMLQLQRQLPLDPARLCVIELRGAPERPSFWRWRLEWEGRNPIAARSEQVFSARSNESLAALLEAEDESGDSLGSHQRRTG